MFRSFTVVELEKLENKSKLVAQFKDSLRYTAETLRSSDCQEDRRIWNKYKKFLSWSKMYQRGLAEKDCGS